MSPAPRLPLLSWTVLGKSFQDLDYFRADALTRSGGAGSVLHRLRHPEGLTDGSVPACKWARVSLLCLLGEEHAVPLQHFSVCQASRVILRGPETAWPPPGQTNECCCFNEVWNLYALRGEAMLGRPSLAVSTTDGEKRWLRSSR